MFDLKQINLVLAQLEEEKGVKKEQIIEAIEFSLASAYKKEFGKKGQMITATFNLETGDTDFKQVKQVVSPDEVIVLENEEDVMPDQDHLPEEERKIRFNPEQHMFVEQARLIKTDAAEGDELFFDLENKTDFGRIAAQTAKQVIIQKIREAEKGYLSEKFGDREGEIIQGTVQRVERGTIFVDLGKAEGVVPFGEQIKSERYKTGDRITGYLFSVDEGGRGIFLRVSRTHPEFLRKLFEREVPELTEGVIEIKHIAREPGFRSKVAVVSHDEEVDPIGALVGQNGSRVQTVTSELSGERIDIIEWSEDTEDFIRQALSPADILDVELTESEEERIAKVQVSEDQFSLAIGRGGQNVRLAARLTGFKIDIEQLDAMGNVIDQEARKAEMEAERAAQADAEASALEAEAIEEENQEHEDGIDVETSSDPQDMVPEEAVETEETETEAVGEAVHEADAETSEEVTEEITEELGEESADSEEEKKEEG